MRFSLKAKRLIDLFLAALLIVALSPIMLLVVVAIGLVLGRPVFFRQQRIGLHSEPFTIIKFRTMTGEPAAQFDPQADTARVTRLGRILRATGLDELPQLWNVIRGHMSLVGPRPLHVHYIDCYTPEQARRHEIRPGITGWAQVNGRSNLNWEQQLKLDVWYVDNHSFWLDMSILARSALIVLGLSADRGVVTRPEFTGTGSAAATDVTEHQRPDQRCAEGEGSV